MIDHFSDSRIIQHHVGNRHLNIDHQTVRLMSLTKAHGPDQDIIAVFTLFLDIRFIFMKRYRYLPCFHKATILYSKFPHCLLLFAIETGNLPDSVKKKRCHNDISLNIPAYPVLILFFRLLWLHSPRG